jgi:hypothetical protein
LQKEPFAAEVEKLRKGFEDETNPQNVGLQARTLKRKGTDPDQQIIPPEDNMDSDEDDRDSKKSIGEDVWNEANWLMNRYMHAIMSEDVSEESIQAAIKGSPSFQEAQLKGHRVLGIFNPSNDYFTAQAWAKTMCSGRRSGAFFNQAMAMSNQNSERLGLHFKAFAKLMRPGLDLIIISNGKSDTNTEIIRKMLADNKMQDNCKKLSLLHSVLHDRMFT